MGEVVQYKLPHDGQSFQVGTIYGYQLKTTKAKILGCDATNGQESLVELIDETHKRHLAGRSGYGQADHLSLSGRWPVEFHGTA